MLSVPRVVPPWITVQDVDADGGTDSASTGSGGRSRAEALSAFRRRVSSSVSASMRVKKSNRSAGKSANPHPPPLRTRCKSVSFEVTPPAAPVTHHADEADFSRGGGSTWYGEGGSVGGGGMAGA